MLPQLWGSAALCEPFLLYSVCWDLQLNPNGLEEPHFELWKWQDRQIIDKDISLCLWSCVFTVTSQLTIRQRPPPHAPPVPHYERQKSLGSQIFTKCHKVSGFSFSNVDICGGALVAHVVERLPFTKAASLLQRPRFDSILGPLLHVILCFSCRSPAVTITIKQKCYVNKTKQRLSNTGWDLRKCNTYFFPPPP